MNWVVVLLQLIAMAPKGLEILEKLVDIAATYIKLERARRTEEELARREKELDHAVGKAEKEKDTSELEDLFRRPR